MSQFRKDVFYVVRGITTTFAVLLAIATLVGASLLGLVLFWLGEDSSLRTALLPGIQARVPVIALMTTVYWGLLTYLGGIAPKLGTRFTYLSGAIALFAIIVSISGRS